ncbi:hypothetical protein EG68_03805 [Paragonimus skrjabini miyazakii]|uniref:Frizzled 5/8 n=1 Tax=Paragonimus skrjabini miyazakii TaxID=59628 RepID=A0A8S9Z0S7_9TREM|nr:hypothetical protein EG68_03805 [Paragonimus skrjabini miyazakii]
MIWIYEHRQQFNDLRSRFGYFWARLFCVVCCIMYFGPRMTVNGTHSSGDLRPGTVYFTSEHGTLRVNRVGKEQKQSNQIFEPENFELQQKNFAVAKRRTARSLPRSSNGAKLTGVHAQDEVPTEYHASLNSPIATPGESEHLLRPEKCIPIEIPLCKNIGYNLTYMPNAFHHETQEEAGLEVHQFYPLVEINCSEDLRLFLCSMYTPICLPNWHYRLTACRSLCESARDGCMPVMGTYGFGWPERMNCDLLPEGSECVSRRNSTGSGTVNSGDQTTSKQNVFDKGEGLSRKESNFSEKKTNATTLLIQDLLTAMKTRFPDKMNKGLWEIFEKNEVLQKGLMQMLKRGAKDGPDEHALCLPCRCREPFIPAHKPPYNEVITGGVLGCLPSCRSPAFNGKSDRTFTTFWLGLWAVLCILSTLATVATFIADPGRFQYPERPIIYLSACYLMVALGYLIRVGLGHDSIACDGPVLRRGSTGPAQCSIVFLLTYVFGMASSVWWVILTLTWFLAAGLKWGSEAIAKYSQLYHFLAWFFPGAQTIFVLIMSAIDGDPVGGLCYVGSTDLTHLRIFVLAPMCLYLGLGTVFLMAGFVALFKIRSEIKLQARGHLKTDKLEKLMIRIGIFGVLYTVPATVVIGCICYELSNREAWNRSHNCPCLALLKLDEGWPETVREKLTSLFGKHKIAPVGLTERAVNEKMDGIFEVGTEWPTYTQQQHLQHQPEHAVFMLKYFMSLVVGITSGFWIWSSKTLDSWQSCLRRIATRSCSTKTKRSPNAAVPVLSTVGQAIPGLSHQPACSMAWNSGQAKLWINNAKVNTSNNMKPLGVGGTSFGVGSGSCTTWQEDFGPTARLLPQPPSGGLTCNHSLGLHMGLNGVVTGSGGSITGGPGLSSLQNTAGMYAPGLMDGVALNSGSTASQNGPHHTPTGGIGASGGVGGCPTLDNSNLLVINNPPITHI